MSGVLQTAQYWSKNQIAAIPIVPGEKIAAIKWKPFQTSLPSVGQIEAWFRSDTNLAIVTGHRGLAVIDFDDRDIFDDWQRYGDAHPIARIVQKFTYQVETVKGRHVYVRLPEATKSRPLIKPDGTRWGIDIKSRGGYVLVPPSVHPSGVPYRALNVGAPVLFVAALSDILPAEMLVRPQYRPQRVAARVVQPSLDPWAAAMNPTRLGPGTVARIKDRYRLEDILPVEERTGQDFYMTRCPLHDDRHPSMWVNTKEQICGCYAGCNALPLDFINLYARIHDLGNREAILELAKGI